MQQDQGILLSPDFQSHHESKSGEDHDYNGMMRAANNGAFARVRPATSGTVPALSQATGPSISSSDVISGSSVGATSNFIASSPASPFNPSNVPIPLNKLLEDPYSLGNPGADVISAIRLHKGQNFGGLKHENQSVLLPLASYAPVSDQPKPLLPPSLSWCSTEYILHPEPASAQSSWNHQQRQNSVFLELIIFYPVNIDPTSSADMNAALAAMRSDNFVTDHLFLGKTSEAEIDESMSPATANPPANDLSSSSDAFLMGSSYGATASSSTSASSMTLTSSGKPIKFVPSRRLVEFRACCDGTTRKVAKHKETRVREVYEKYRDANCYRFGWVEGPLAMVVDMATRSSKGKEGKESSSPANPVMVLQPRYATAFLRFISGTTYTVRIASNLPIATRLNVLGMDAKTPCSSTRTMLYPVFDKSDNKLDEKLEEKKDKDVTGMPGSIGSPLAPPPAQGQSFPYAPYPPTEMKKRHRGDDGDGGSTGSGTEEAGEGGKKRKGGSELDEAVPEDHDMKDAELKEALEKHGSDPKKDVSSLEGSRGSSTFRAPVARRTAGDWAELQLAPASATEGVVLIAEVPPFPTGPVKAEKPIISTITPMAMRTGNGGVGVGPLSTESVGFVVDISGTVKSPLASAAPDPLSGGASVSTPGPDHAKDPAAASTAIPVAALSQPDGCGSPTLSGRGRGRRRKGRKEDDSEDEEDAE